MKVRLYSNQIYFKGKQSPSLPESQRELLSADLSAIGISTSNAAILRDRFDKGSTFAQIAAKTGHSKAWAFSKTGSGVLAIEEASGTIPKELSEKIQAFKTTFKKDLSNKAAIKVFKLQPSLITYPIENMKGNIGGVVEIFKEEGLKKEDYIKAAINRPSLFISDPNRIENRVRDLVKIFENEGLTTKEYLKAALTEPSLFYNNPETIEYNIRNLAKRFKKEGLETKDYLQVALRHPKLFVRKPSVIEKHIRMYKFMVKDELSQKSPAGEIMSDKELLKLCLKKNLAYSDSHIYLEFLNKKIFKSINENKLPNINIKEKLTGYIKANPKEYSFSVVDDQCAQEFIKFVQEFSMQTLGKNIFKIAIKK